MGTLKAIVKHLLMVPARSALRLAGVSIGDGVRVYGRTRISRFPGSTIELGDGVILNSSNRRNTLEARGPVVFKTLSPRAKISVGRNAGFTSATVSSAVDVTIGDRVLIGAGTLITDSDHHIVEPPAGQHRRFLGLPQAKDGDRVLIGNDVFLGARTIILKGSTIGSGSVIGAGSVVSGDIPSMVIAAGNPCRVIRQIRA